MNYFRKVILSKLCSKILRHQADKYGLHIDKEGFADINELQTILNDIFGNVQLSDIYYIVQSDSKQRFGIIGNKIRCHQGHTLDSVDISFSKQQPPDILYHGTSSDFIESIKDKGLIPKKRHHVHLITDIAVAKENAIRYAKSDGKVVILKINAKKMFEDGIDFFVSDNNVWLAKTVPTDYIIFPKPSIKQKNFLGRTKP